MAKSKDLSGQRFGRLTAIKNVGANKWGSRLWLCRCDCGNEITVAATYLVKGEARSCGCLKKERDIFQAEDLTGRKFGRLTVIRRAENKNGRVMWLCKCDCGNTVIADPNHLKSGHTTSCGCVQRESKKKRIGDIDGSSIGIWGIKKAHPSNHLGIRGVSERNGKFIAHMSFKGKSVLYKTFDNLEDAIKARQEAVGRYAKPYVEENIKAVEEERKEVKQRRKERLLVDEKEKVKHGKQSTAESQSEIRGQDV